MQKELFRPASARDGPEPTVAEPLPEAPEESPGQLSSRCSIARWDGAAQLCRRSFTRRIEDRDRVTTVGQRFLRQADERLFEVIILIKPHNFFGIIAAHNRLIHFAETCSLVRQFALQAYKRRDASSGVTNLLYGDPDRASQPTQSESALANCSMRASALPVTQARKSPHPAAENYVRGLAGIC